MAVSMPANEIGRLRVLYATGLLDTEPEERFDRLCRLARRMFNVKYAFVSLVDQDRQWFKSGNLEGVIELPRSESICAHAIVGDDVLVCEDLSQDTRFAEIAAVRDFPRLRFYAGAPLVLEGSYSIGTLSLADTVPRQFAEEDKASLGDLAASVVDEIALLRERELRQRLAASEAREHAILGTVLDVFFILSPDGRIQYCNNDSASPLDTTDAIGGYLDSILGEKGADLAREKIEQAVLSGDPKIFEFEVIHQSGSQLLFEARLIKQNNQTVFMVCRDITRQRQALNAEQDRARMGAVINRIQSQQIRYADFNKTFGVMLKDILLLIDAEFGMICDIEETDDEQDCGLSVRVVCTENKILLPSNQFIPTLNDLFYSTLNSRKAVIDNHVREDPCPLWRERGFPALNNYLGIPVILAGRPVTMLVLANRARPFDSEIIQYLQPLLFTLAQLVQASAMQEQKRQIQSEIIRLSRVASQTTNGVVITDAKGRIEWINDGFSRIAGYTLEEIKGLSPGRILQGEHSDLKVVEEMTRAVEAREPFDVELINYHKSGRPYWIHISCNPLLNDAHELEGFIAIESDITDRKLLEGVKDQFIANVSHELKTPLTALNGALSLLQAQEEGVPAQDLLIMAARNGHRLELLINDLLDAERLVQGKVSLRMADLEIVPLLLQAVADNKVAAAGRSIYLELDSQVMDIGRQTIRVDQLRFHQIINNLIANAIKFSPADDTVSISATIRGDACQISVIDHGSGIPDSFRSHIFKRFSQADSGNCREHGGTGLGLAISKELVERMQGQIGFESQPGRCHFYFTVPLSEEQRWC